MNRLDAIVSHAASAWPERPALSVGEREVSFLALEDGVKRVASFLIHRGLKPGERVAILAQNSPPWVALYFGISRAGGIAVPLNTALPVHDLEQLLRDAEPRFLFYDEAMRAKATALGDSPNLGQSQKGTVPNWDCPLVFSIKDIRPVRWNVTPVPVSLTDVASILYTSGTTGQPRGVMLSHENLLTNQTAVAQSMGIGPDDRVVCVLPFYYVFGLSLLLSHLATGACVVIENRFAYPAVILESLGKRGVTGFAGVSSHFAILMNHGGLEKQTLPYLRYFAQAGDGMPAALTRRLVKAFPQKKIFLMYGQTEAGPRLTCLDPERVSRKPNSVGSALEGVEIRIVGDRGDSRSVKEEGHILVRGKNIMMGYWRKPEATRAALRNGWLHTGDLGYLDAEGDLFITGRESSFLKIGGHRVNPFRIEAAALEHPAVAEAMVQADQDSILGSTVRLLVVLRQDISEKGVPENLKKFLATRLMRFEVPSEIHVTKAVPKNSFGKIIREELSWQTHRS